MDSGILIHSCFHTDRVVIQEVNFYRAVVEARRKALLNGKFQLEI